MKYKILLVDDEKDIVEFLQYNLESSGFKVIKAFDGEEALIQAQKKPDLILLDIMMPKLDGYAVFRELKKDEDLKDIPIIFLTAKASETDEIFALNLGAHDFIKKPISPKKLVARVKSNLRKHEGREKINIESNVIKIGLLEIDKDKFVVKVDGSFAVLPKKEFEILFFLATNPGKVYSREQILDEVWGKNIFVVERTIDVHIRKIREKLGKYSPMIETVKSVGYKFKEDI